MGDYFITDSKCPFNNTIKVYYPFFANTYLLPYYVSNNKIFGNIIEPSIYRWDKNELTKLLEQIKNDPSENISIFYATKRLLGNSIEQLDLTFYESKVLFSFYQPQLMFVPFSLNLYREHYSQRGFDNSSLPINFIKSSVDLEIVPSFQDLKDYFINFNLKDILFTDTIDEAAFIHEQLRKSDYFVFEQNKPYIKLLYYSAPYSIYLLNQYPEFLPVRINFLNPESIEYKEYFETFNYVICKFRTCPLRSACQLTKQLEDFHKEIFYIALEAPKLLFDIFKEYVNKNSEQIPFHIFKNVDCFAKSITLHHHFSDEANDKTVVTIQTFNMLLKGHNSMIYNQYNKYLNRFIECSTESQVLLIYHYLLTTEHGGQKGIIFKDIANALLNKTFLNGKYYFVFDNFLIINYSLFRNEISTVQNPIKSLKLSVSENCVFSIYKSFILETVYDKIKRLNLPDSCYILEEALKNEYNVHFSTIYNLQLISEEDFQGTLNELSEIRTEIFNKFYTSSLFNNEDKFRINQLKESFKKDPVKKESAVDPDPDFL